MTETVKFLRKSAEELRRLAELAPDISDQLRQLADEVDEMAAGMEQRQRRPG